MVAVVVEELLLRHQVLCGLSRVAAAGAANGAGAGAEASDAVYWDTVVRTPDTWMEERMMKMERGNGKEVLEGSNIAPQNRIGSLFL